MAQFAIEFFRLQGPAGLISEKEMKSVPDLLDEYNGLTFDTKSEITISSGAEQRCPQS